jgi:hypothetical protein
MASILTLTSPVKGEEKNEIVGIDLQVFGPCTHIFSKNS